MRRQDAYRDNLYGRLKTLPNSDSLAYLVWVYLESSVPIIKNFSGPSVLSDYALLTRGVYLAITRRINSRLSVLILQWSRRAQLRNCSGSSQ